MEFSNQHQSTLFAILDAVYQRPSFSDLCQFLATTVCPTGELARVYVGRLDNDGVIRTAASFGYPLEVEVSKYATRLEASEPMSNALRSREVIMGSKEEILKKYPNYKPLDMRSAWISEAAAPTLGSHVYLFGLQCKIDNPEFARLYFGIVGKILSFYDAPIEEIRQTSQDNAIQENIFENARPYLNSQLTERQQLILGLINEKKTNVQIAAVLGYSESLIRQETIIIYAKLGVNGRKELITQDQT